MLIDNVDDVHSLFDPAPGVATTEPASRGPACLDYLPVCDHGFVLFISRDRNAAAKLADPSNIVDFHPMDEELAVELLKKKV